MAGLNVKHARAGLWVVAAGFALAACSTTPTQMNLTTGGVGSAPAPVSGYDWLLNEHGDEAQLVYGVDETDDVLLNLICTGPNGRLEVSAPGPRGGVAEIRLESGGETTRLDATSEASDIDDGDWLTAVGRTTDPVFQRFRQVGWIALWQGDQRRSLAPQPGSVSRIDKFFSRCG